MLIKGMTLSQFTGCADDVSAMLYYENVVVSRDSADLPDTAYTNTGRGRAAGRAQCRARLAVTSSYGPGSRTAASAHPVTGNRRHGPWACWHAFRDVLTEAFTRYPDAVITAGHAWKVTYRGMAGFRESYPATGTRNVGSRAEPVTMPQLCQCAASTRYSTAGEQAGEAIALARANFFNRYWRALEPRQAVSGSVLEPERTWAGSMARGSIAVPDTSPYDDPSYVSPELWRASEQLARSEKLLKDPWSDETVFGPPPENKKTTPRTNT